MPDERFYWHVCVDDGEDWGYLGVSHDTRAEAEAELRSLRSKWPEAFVVRLTLTRMEQKPLRPILQLFHGQKELRP